MSTELAPTTKEFILSALKQRQKNSKPWSIANLDPKQWLLVSTHAWEGSKRDVSKFIKKHDISRWTYYRIKKDMNGAEGYEEQRDLWAEDTIADIDMMGDAQRKTTEVFLDKISDPAVVASLSVKDAAQASMQFARAQTMAISNFQKLTGAVTQTIIVEHKTTLDEAKAFAAKMADKVIEV